MNSPLVSIIIPCYNMGEYIGEAIQSVLKQPYNNIEIIIVNDGSTDEETNRVVSEINHPKIKVINTPNQGLAVARNTGIRNSTGKYILPLDADDKISSTYITDAVQLLEADENVGIVYGTSIYFGEKEGIQELEKFDKDKIIFYNQVYCSGFFRRSDFDKTDGYDSAMKYGWEDWEFWLSILELGREVKFIDKPSFYYRVRSGSMVRSMTEKHKRFLQRIVYSKHSNLYTHLFSDPISLYYDYVYYRKEYEKMMSNNFIKILYKFSRLFNK